MTEKLILQSEASGTSDLAWGSASRWGLWLVGSPALALFIILVIRNQG